MEGDATNSSGIVIIAAISGVIVVIIAIAIGLFIVARKAARNRRALKTPSRASSSSTNEGLDDDHGVSRSDEVVAEEDSGATINLEASSKKRSKKVWESAALRVSKKRKEPIQAWQ